MKSFNNTAPEINDIPLLGLGLKHVDVGSTLLSHSMAREKICGIYKITSPSGRVYIGQSIHILKRKERYQYLGCIKQAKIYNSLLKYGWEAHIFEIIHRCNPEELNHWEDYYINLHDCFSKNRGLNLRSGGTSTWKMSDETKEKLRIQSTGRKKTPETLLKLSKAAKGRKLSPEHKKKLSIANTGKKRSKEFKERIGYYNTIGIMGTKGKKIINKKGHVVSEKTKEKLRKHFTGKKRPPHVIEAMRQACIGREPWNKGKKMSKKFRESVSNNSKDKKPVSQYDLNDNHIADFPSIKDASKHMKVTPGLIGHCVNNRTKTAAGFIWKFKNNK